MANKCKAEDDFKKVIDKHFGRINHLENRIDEYHSLVWEIDTLCEGSNSKLSFEIKRLIGKHYQM